MTHTPGPWKVDKLGTMGDYELSSNNYPLAMLYHSQIHDTEANAHLIAAAPELLDACKYTLENLQHYQTHNQIFITAMEGIKQALALMEGDE